MISTIEFKNKANRYDLKSIDGLKSFAGWLIDNGMDAYLYNTPYESIIKGIGIYPYEIMNAMLLVSSERSILNKYGDVGKEYISTYDKCVELKLSNHYFENNRYGLLFDDDMCKKNPHLYSFSTFSESTSYNQSIQFSGSYNNYFVHIDDLGIEAFKIITDLLKEKIKEELEYRKKNSWDGEIDLEEFANKLQKLYPKLQIEVREGKRAYDKNYYKAIVVEQNGWQLGSFIIDKDYRDVASLTRRVPFTGECSYDVTKENIMAELTDGIEFMLH